MSSDRFFPQDSRTGNSMLQKEYTLDKHRWVVSIIYDYADQQVQLAEFPGTQYAIPYQAPLFNIRLLFEGIDADNKDIKYLVYYVQHNDMREAHRKVNHITLPDAYKFMSYRLDSVKSKRFLETFGIVHQKEIASNEIIYKEIIKDLKLFRKDMRAPKDLASFISAAMNPNGVPDLKPAPSDHPKYFATGKDQIADLARATEELAARTYNDLSVTHWDEKKERGYRR